MRENITILILQTAKTHPLNRAPQNIVQERTGASISETQPEAARGYQSRVVRLVLTSTQKAFLFLQLPEPALRSFLSYEPEKIENLVSILLQALYVYIPCTVNGFM